MTPQQLTGIGVRLFSIMLAITSIPYLSAIPRFLQLYGKSDSVSDAVIIGILYLVVALLIWFFPMSVSHKLVPKTAFENRFNTRPDEVATVGVALLGLWKLIDAVPDLVSYLFKASLNAGNFSIFEALGTEGKTDVTFILVEIVIALFFIFKAHTVAKFITKQFANDAS